MRVLAIEQVISGLLLVIDRLFGYLNVDLDLCLPSHWPLELLNGRRSLDAASKVTVLVLLSEPTIIVAEMS